MLVAHRIRLDPNNVQATYFARAAGTARFAYNWALTEWQKQYEASKTDPTRAKPSEAALRRQLNGIKREYFPWMLAVTKNAPQIAIMQLGRAFENFFTKRACYPRFRKKGRDDCFSLSNDLFRVEGRRIRANAKLKLAKLHARIANIRRDSLHQLSTSITRRFHTIGIEDLNVKGMLGNRRLARAIADMGFYELRRQLEYKAAWRGGQVVLVDRWYPSSKLCSCCGYRLEKLGLDVRHWTCPGCGTFHDRDVNAAINLRNMAVSSTASACGGKALAL